MITSSCIMENQMEKSIDNKMDTGVIRIVVTEILMVVSSKSRDD